MVAVPTSALPEPLTLCVLVLMSQTVGPASLVSWTGWLLGTTEPLKMEGMVASTVLLGSIIVA